MQVVNRFIHIRSSRFPILPGEEEELVNEGTYGKALAEYLQVKLTELGYNVPSTCCEDWGWWVELKGAPFAYGVCVYANSEQPSPVDFVCTDGASGPRTWSWKKFRFVETGPWVDKLHADLVSIFESDDDVEIVGIAEEFPW